MSIPQTIVKGRVAFPDDQNPISGVVQFQISGVDYNAVNDTVVLNAPRNATISDATGNISIALFPNGQGGYGTHYEVSATAYTNGGAVTYPLGRIVVPDTGPVDLNDLLPLPLPADPTNADYVAQLAASQAGAEASAVAAAASVALINGKTPEQYGAIAKPVIETQTRTVFDAMTVKPTREHLRAMDMAILQMKWAGVWGDLDWLVVASADKAGSYVNWKAPGTGDLSEATTMPFTAGVGFEAGSGGRLVTSGYSFDDMAGYAQDDAHFGVFTAVANERENSPLVGSSDGSDDAYIIPHRDSSDDMRGRLNSGGTLDFPNTKSNGHFLLNRSSAAEVRGFIDGKLVGTVADTSSGVPTDDIEVGLVTSSDSGGTMFAAHAGAALADWQVRALWWILDNYFHKVKGLVGKGTPVTAAELDATVDLAVNTAAMQSFFNACTGNTMGFLSEETYLVNDQLVLPDNPQLRGTPWRTRVRADVSMANDKALCVQGDGVTESIGGDVRGILWDYNLDRDGFTTGGVGNDTDGSAFALHCVSGGHYEDVHGLSGHKHGFDILAETYNRSGTAGQYNTPHSLVSSDIYVNNVGGWGCGDDCFTAHGAHRVYGGWVRSGFGRATYSTGNSNGLEADDFTDGVDLEGVHSIFCHRAVEVKGHDDALPATNVRIGAIISEHCAVIQFRHIGHDGSGEPATPIDASVQIGTLIYRDPLHWDPSGVFATDRQALTAANYKSIEVGEIYASANGASEQCTAELVQFFDKAANVSVNKIKLEGFVDAVDGVKLSANVEGSNSLGQLIIDDGPSQYGLDVEDGPICVVGSYNITRSGTAGTSAIRGKTGKLVLGAGYSDGYTTAEDLT